MNIIKTITLTLAAGVFAVSAWAHCGGCGPAPTPKVKAVASKSCGTCPIQKTLFSGLQLSGPQKAQVDAAYAEFRKKLETILTKQQLSAMSKACASSGKCPAPAKAPVKKMTSCCPN
ncbi:MAG: hypothetical protein HQL32_17295 [Planctomycetes bacterium]|nr:hypothetical protein [Planctomycetota bacterium]